MLPTPHRLRRAADFQRVVRRGRRASTDTLVVHALCEEGGRQPQVGFVVGRRVGNAVTRNRVRRRLRHLMRDRVGGLPGGMLVVARANTSASSADFHRLGRDLDRCLAKVEEERR